MATPPNDKKPKLTDSADDGGSPKASAELVQSIGRLQDIQDELRNIDERESEEILALEMKFNELRKPVFARRNEVIESIHEFWLTVFLSHPTLGNLLSKEDEKILKYMISLEVEEDENSGYSIIFNFAPNPYFDDAKLTKTYCFDEVENLSISCEPIKWKEGKDVTNNSGHDKGAKRPYSSESFFTWFSKNVRSDGQVDEIAEIIKDDLWPNPLGYLQNEVDAMGLHQEGEGEAEEVTGGGNESMSEDEEDDDEEEGFDDNEKEYHEEDGDDEEQEDDDMD